MFFRKVSQTMDIIQQKQNIRRMLALHQKTNTKVDNREKQKIKGMKKEMQAWSEGIALGKYSGQFEYISPAAASSPKFLEEYQSSANQYASFNKQHNIGNINYHQATTCKPQNLINVINLTYNK